MDPIFFKKNRPLFYFCMLAKDLGFGAHPVNAYAKAIGSAYRIK